MIEWDKQKSIKNQQKHGLAFDDANQIFDDFHIERLDDRLNYNEDRYIVLGILNTRIIVLVYTPRGEKKRIISLRKANEREKKIYTQRLQAFGCNG